MAHHASALKQMRQSLKRRARNRHTMSALRTQIKKLRAALDKGETAAAQILSETVSAIDRAAKKGTIHVRTASRYKSRLAHRAAAKKR